MLQIYKNSLKLTGPAGSISVPPSDEVILKVAMLFEGECEGLGPTQAAAKFGYSKQRYFQLLNLFRTEGAEALQSKPRGPKSNYRRTDELIRRVIRHRFIDPEASAQVIAQTLKQADLPIGIRSVERIIADFGLQKKTLRPVS
jgi:transposase